MVVTQSLLALLTLSSYALTIHGWISHQNSLQLKASSNEAGRVSDIRLQACKVFVCTDQSCERQNALSVLEYLRTSGVPANEMGCPGRCGNGPVLGVDSLGEEYRLIEEAHLGSKEVEGIVNSARQ